MPMAEEDVVYPILYEVEERRSRRASCTTSSARVKGPLRVGKSACGDSRICLWSTSATKRRWNFHVFARLLQDRRHVSLAGKILREEALVL